MTTAPHRCRNFCPPTWTAPWRDWHRGHGCHLDPLVGKPTPNPARIKSSEEQPSSGSAPDCLSCADLKAQFARLTRAQEEEKRKADNIYACYQHALSQVERAESRLRAMEAQQQELVAEIASFVEHLRDGHQSTTEPVGKVARLIRERFTGEATPRARTQTRVTEDTKGQ